MEIINQRDLMQPLFEDSPTLEWVGPPTAHPNDDPAAESMARKQSEYLAVMSTIESTLEVPVLAEVDSSGAVQPLREASELLSAEAFLRRSEDQEVFTARLKGESLSGALLFDGDYLLVSRTREPVPGDLVAVIVDGEATCRYYFPEEDVIRLCPVHPDHRPISVNRSETHRAVVLGVVESMCRMINRSAQRHDASRELELEKAEASVWSTGKQQPS